MGSRNARANGVGQEGSAGLALARKKPPASGLSFVPDAGGFLFHATVLDYHRGR
jgi:hypothetical protein